MHVKFLKNQCDIENTTQELERLGCSFDELDLWVKERIEGMKYEDWEEKGRRRESYLLMLRYMFQQYKTGNQQRSRAIRDDTVVFSRLWGLLYVFLSLSAPVWACLSCISVRFK